MPYEVVFLMADNRFTITFFISVLAQVKILQIYEAEVSYLMVTFIKYRVTA